MSSYPETQDVFTDLNSTKSISSSDPNHAFESIENVEGFLGALGKPQSWSETLLVTLRGYRRGLRVDYDGTLYVRAGEAVLVSSDGNKTLLKRNSSDVTITAANIDGGTLISTFYYIYAQAAVEAATLPIVFSSNPQFPSGIGTAPFQKIGWFKNCAAGSLALTFAGNWKEFGDVSNAVIGSYELLKSLSFTSYSEFVTQPLTLHVVTSGRPLMIDFCGSFQPPAGQDAFAEILIDGVAKQGYQLHSGDGTDTNTLGLHWLDGLVGSGAHVIKVRMHVAAGSGQLLGTHTFTAVEL